MTKHRTRAGDAGPATSEPAESLFEPATPRARHDGWTPERQVAFIEALGECGCVDEACRRVGMGTSAAYALRRRPEAQSFRRAWEAALDLAVDRLSDAAFARAVNGVSRPVFYKGEQIGERRHYDERLTQFLLRYRDPVRYGAWLDQREAQRHPDGPALTLSRLVNRLAEEAHDRADGHWERRPPIPPSRRTVSPTEAAEAEERADRDRIEAAERADQAAYRRTCAEEDGEDEYDEDDDYDDTDEGADAQDEPRRDEGEDSAADVACGSSGSAADRAPEYRATEDRAAAVCSPPSPTTPGGAPPGAGSGYGFGPVTPGFRPPPHHPNNGPALRAP
ncbi:hypothetical protein [Sphingomonas sp.]|jgi:hypothetical protein|uniref:hypothetical protein n=1 Tax=Sphingomonas sp. TaxID=28214 RepID=UPI002ED7FCE1